MDRVVTWADDLLEAGVADEVVVQAAAFRVRPRLAGMIGVVDGATLAGLMRGAERVVTHGGPGTILQAIALGREPLVIPRDPARNEHVDDHQVRFSRWLASRMTISVITSYEELVAALGRPERPAGRQAGRSAAVDRIRSLLLTRG
jgi:UDP-N-acetylglucosamine transferase subunit ALG13